MGYDVVVENLEPQPVAVFRQIAKREELSAVVPRLCGEAWAAVKAYPEVQLPGALMVAIYGPAREGEPCGNELAVQVGVQVAGHFEGSGGLVFSTTPEGPIAHTRHVGSYGRLGEAHRAIQDWCRANGRSTGVNWEIYGHWSDDESQLRTDVFYLLN